MVRKEELFKTAIAARDISYGDEVILAGKHVGLSFAFWHKGDVLTGKDEACYYITGTEDQPGKPFPLPVLGYCLQGFVL